MTTDYAHLRALAEAATPGPWHHAQHPADDQMHDIRGPINDAHNVVIYAECEPEDAAYIAAADPPTLIALLDRLEELEGREPKWEYAVVAGQTTLPARFDDLIEAERHARAWSASAEVLRRRKAGPWEPVTGDDDA